MAGNELSRTGELAIIVVNFRSSALLSTHLATLAVGDLPVRIVVVDNFSSARERDLVAGLAAEHGWTFVPLPDNRGFSAGVNAGARAAAEFGAAALLLLNPDAVVSAEVVAELRADVLAHPRELISPRVVSRRGGWSFTGSRLLLRSGRTAGGEPDPALTHEELPWLTGSCLALHADLFAELGGLDERYFMYWEDVDLSFRCLRAGGRVRVRHDLEAVHEEGGTQANSAQRAKSALYYRYNCRNRLLFAAAHLDRRLVRRWMLLSPAVGWEILMRGGRRQLLSSPAVVPAMVSGTVLGLAAAARALLRPRTPAPTSGPTAADRSEVPEPQW